MESVLQELAITDKYGDGLVVSLGEQILIAPDSDAGVLLSHADAARLRDWLNAALGDSGCACARPDDADEPECSFTAEKVDALYDDMLADLRKLRADEPEIYEGMKGADYVPAMLSLRKRIEALEAEYPSADIFCDCDDDEPDVDMVELRMWAVERSGGMYCTKQCIENAETLVDYVLNGPAA
jgi:hypothetical protein